MLLRTNAFNFLKNNPSDERDSLKSIYCCTESSVMCLYIPVSTIPIKLLTGLFHKHNQSTKRKGSLFDNPFGKINCGTPTFAGKEEEKSKQQQSMARWKF